MYSFYFPSVSKEIVIECIRQMASFMFSRSFIIPRVCTARQVSHFHPSNCLSSICLFVVCVDVDFNYIGNFRNYWTDYCQILGQCCEYRVDGKMLTSHQHFDDISSKLCTFTSHQRTITQLGALYLLPSFAEICP